MSPKISSFYKKYRTPRIRKGQAPFARGMGCPQKILFYFKRNTARYTWGYVRGSALARGMGCPQKILFYFKRNTARYTWGIRKGQAPLTRGMGCPQNLFYFIFQRAILVAGWQGRPQGSPLPDCMASCVPRGIRN